MSTYHQCDRCQSMIGVIEYIDNGIEVGRDLKIDLCYSCFGKILEYIKSWVGE